ncbi:hypothetical protein JHK82_039905 [Glycine max]|nr:hypothetical protein JHK86_040104 [Glycine max]KAG4965711.1 hypothetical protein JHK85_040686 [Glycine max]KAG5110682.1 hypothetical protein JHK82_039905 [Glycine max]
MWENSFAVLKCCREGVLCTISNPIHNPFSKLYLQSQQWLPAVVSFLTYESNVLFALRFMIDCNIVGRNWIEIPVGKYKKTVKTLPYCQYSQLVSHAPEGEYSEMSPFRMLSFYIEFAGRKGHFPEPTHDPVIQDLIHEVDPDIIIGYNICKFHLPYVIKRVANLKIAEFPILGRIRNSRVRVKDTTFSSR